MAILTAKPAWTAKRVNTKTGVGLIHSDDGSKPNTIWRFYTNQSHQWKWQKVTVSHEVIAESHMAYKDYKSCLVNAKDKGYVFQPSQAKISSATPQRFNYR